MQEALVNPVVHERKNTITSRIHCVNTGHTYVYELLNGEIISEEKVQS